MSQIEVDRGGFQSFFGYVSDDAGETFSQTFTATGTAITHLTFPVDLDTSSTATMRVLIADVTGGAIGAILYDSGTISIAPIPSESLSYGGGPFRDINLDMNVATVPGHQYVILFDGLPDADGSDRIVLGWNPDSSYSGGSAGYWFADPSVGLSFASNSPIPGDYAFTMTFADANVVNGTPGDDRGDTALVGTNGDDIINGFAGNDELLGLGGNDVLNGDEGHDTLRGAAGNDILNGGDGDDFLNGNIGDDVINGGAGFDRATFASGAVAGVTVDLNLQGIAQDTGQGMDTLTGIEHVSGTAFDDTLTGDGGDNWIWGQGGTDVLAGNGGNDLITSGAPGNLTADGGSGIDTLSVNDNGAGSSGVTVSLALQGGAQATGIGSYTLSGFENLSGSSANDTLTGDDNTNVLAGDRGNDALSGGAGDDTLYGDGQIIVDTHGLGGSGPITTIADGGALDPGFVEGDDTLEGGLGNDTLDGGGGSDTASYEHNVGHVEAFLGATTGGVDEYDAAGNYLSSDFLQNIENLTGSAFDDTLVGNSGDNLIQGLGGNDTILGNGGNDTVIGGDGSDIMRGDTATSVGNDVLIGGDGDDHMRGGAGVDLFDGGSDDGGESIYGGIGDRISFFEVAATQGVVADLRTGVISNDGFGNVESMTGIESLGGDTAFVDTFYGNDGRNTLLGGRGDHLYGFGGDDQFSTAAAAGSIDGGDGTDLLSVNSLGGWLTPDTNADGIAETMGAATEGWFINLLAGQMFDGYGNFGTVTGIENVDGSELDDTIRGNDGNNVLTGGAGDDFILGMGGDDTVIGGDGNDNLRGDNQLSNGGPFGNDILIGGDGDDLMRGGPGVDSFDGGSDTGTINNGFTGYGDRVSFYESAATAGAVADLRTGLISNDGYGNVESMVGVESLGGGTAFADTFYGNDGINFLFADLGDQVYGFGGDDIFQLSSAPGLADGGDGIDRLTLTSSGGFLLPDADSDGVAEAADAATSGWTVDLASGSVVDGYGNSGAIAGFENVDGSELDDTLIGDDNANVLNGLDGNDTLEGRGGDDTLDGGSGIDTASYAGSVGPVEVDLGAGLTFEYAADGITVVSTDTLANIENATGSEFADFLGGSSGNNVLSGLGGDDLIAGEQGDDTLYGGAGFDTAWYASASGSVTVNLATGTASGAAGNDSLSGFEAITGSNFDDVLTGDAGANSLTGRAGNDTLDGGAGDDFLRPGAGDDSIIGGSGFDRVSHYGTNIVGGVTVDLRIAGPQNTGQGWDTYIGIEALSGTRYNDTLIGDDSNNWLIAADGNDTLVGNGGNDLLTISDGELGAASGNHSLDGGSGSDTVDLSWISLGTAGATLSLALQGAAQDSGHGLLTLNNIENLSGTTHNDALTGDGNANTLSGNAGDDLLVGGAGDDSLYGDGAMIADTRSGNGGSGPITFFADVTAFDPSLVDGNDTLEGGAGNDTIDGGGGSDTASYEHNSGRVEAFLGNSGFGGADEYAVDGITLLSSDFLHSIENLTGSAFDDFLQGNNGANVLLGLGGNDNLLGLQGDDTLDGGDGNDTLRGDNGFNAGNDTLLGGNGNDFLNGGNGNDTIDGGAGFDRATFFTAAVAGVHVDLNLQGVAQDTGQGMDTLLNIENVSGTAFGDTLIGDDTDNWLWGSPSTDGVNPPTGSNNDTLDGRGGNDLLMVGTGNHSLTGGSGIDTVAFTENGGIPDPSVTISLALQGGAQATGAGNWTLDGIENLSGGTNNDSLTGDGNANVLAGNTGNDTLVGGGGNDTLYGDGAIQIDYAGGPGTSGPIATIADVTSVDPSLVDGNDTLEGGAGSDTLNGGGGSDTASYEHNGGRVEVFLGGGGADEYDAAGNYLSSDAFVSIENVIGSAFDDFIVGDAGTNHLDGLGGNDQLVGGAGGDTLDGGDGNDNLRGDNGTNSVVGNDTLHGGNGNDFLNGGFGDDFIDGGDGYDRATFFNGAIAGVTVNLNLQGVAQNTGQGMDTLTNIENVSGTAYGDTLIGDGGDNWLWGSTSTGQDGLPTGANNDTIDGGGGNDLLMVGAGNHSLSGGGGTDTVAYTENGGAEVAINVSLALQGAAQATGAGSWTLNGIENLSGGTLGDQLTGDGNANILAGDTGNDTLVGGAGDDTLYGDGRIAIDYAGGPGTSGPIGSWADVTSLDPSLIDGNDVLEGGLGNDTLNGGGGIDTASYAHASGGVNVDLRFGFASGSDGNDSLTSIENVTGSEFDDTINGDGSGNVLSGLGGNDFIQGQGGNDIIYGGDGDDTLRGDAAENSLTVSGDDILYGEGGNDGLRGGLGNDQLYGGSGNDLLRGNGGVDYFDGGSDDGEGFNGIGDRVSFFEARATQGAVADLRTGVISNDGFGNVETMVGIESLGADTAFVDTFYGNDDRNFLGGSRGDNLYGFGGDDLFQIGAAAAVIDGGTGTDLLQLDSSGGWLLPDADADGLAESAAAALIGWTVNLTAGTTLDGYGNAGTVTGIENVNGSQLGDSLTGDANANVLSGLDGNDTLNGRGGDDTLDGGNGSDTANYANATGSVTIDLGGGAASGADGNDVLVSIENAVGSAFNDQLIGNGQANVLSGGDGHDVLRGGGGNDTLLGGNGDDFLNGNIGDDVIDGGAGVDRATFATGAVAGVTVDLTLQGVAQNTGQGMDTLTNIEHVSGTSFNDTLTGDNGDNWIWGQGGNDVLTGNGGNDLIQAGAAGNLTASGGSGTDTLSVNDNGTGSAGVTVSLALQGGAQATGIGSYTLTGFENLSGSNGNDTLTGDGFANLLAGDQGDDTLVGGGGNDTLYGDGQVGTDSHGLGTSGPITTYTDVGLLGGVSGNDTLEGGLGNDTLNGGGGTDTASYANATGSVTVDLTAGTATGADGNDTLTSIENVTGSGFIDQLTGSAGDNILSGGGGNDTLNGRAGNDTLIGGAGTDTASYANASGGVTVSLTSGTATGADGNDTLATIENVIGSAFADTLTGDSSANLLSGGDGDDVLNGRAGNDTLNGGNGNDTASYANATGAVSVNLSTNSATGADGSDTLSSIENAIGSQFADTLRGDDNANVLNGGDGADALLGGKGDDWLYGGNGNDTMTGQQGADRFVIETASGADHVTDFVSGVDKVVFSGIAGIDDFSDLTLTKVGNNTVITWGTGDSLTLDGVRPNQLNASDFQFGAPASFAAAEQIVSKVALGESSDPAVGDTLVAASNLIHSATLDSYSFDHGMVHLTMDGII
jgi:Ca2+-binding RTX toxin-like protein